MACFLSLPLPVFFCFFCGFFSAQGPTQGKGGNDPVNGSMVDVLAGVASGYGIFLNTPQNFAENIAGNIFWRGVMRKQKILCNRRWRRLSKLITRSDL